MHHVRSLQQRRPHSQEDRQSGRGPAAIHILQSSRHQVDGSPGADSHGRSAEGGKLADVSQDDGAELELLVPSQGLNCQLLGALPHVLESPEHAVEAIQLQIGLGDDGVLPSGRSTAGG